MYYTRIDGQWYRIDDHDRVQFVNVDSTWVIPRDWVRRANEDRIVTITPRAEQQIHDLQSRLAQRTVRPDDVWTAPESVYGTPPRPGILRRRRQPQRKRDASTSSWEPPSSPPSSRILDDDDDEAETTSTTAASTRRRPVAGAPTSSTPTMAETPEFQQDLEDVEMLPILEPADLSGSSDRDRCCESLCASPDHVASGKPPPSHRIALIHRLGNGRQIVHCVCPECYAAWQRAESGRRTTCPVCSRRVDAVVQVRCSSGSDLYQSQRGGGFRVRFGSDL